MEIFIRSAAPPWIYLARAANRRYRRAAASAAGGASMIMVRQKKRVLTEHDDRMEEASKAREDKPVSAAEESRVLAMASLTAQVQTMIEESGNPEGFNAAKWVARWIDRPLPALGGQKPVELMGTPDGRALVHNVVARMQSGSYS